MVDIRTIRGKDKTDAFAKARVEFGGNFVILTSKDIKVGGFLGLGTKTEHELRIMLNNSIYDRKNNSMNEDKSYSDEEDEMHRTKLLSDRIEMKKHSSETIDASEMADRIVSITKALKEKRIKGAALDVFSVEPPLSKENELLKLEQLRNDREIKNMQFEIDKKKVKNTPSNYRQHK